MSTVIEPATHPPSSLPRRTAGAPSAPGFSVPYRKLELSLYAIIIAVSVAVGIRSERLNYRLHGQTLKANITETNQSIAFKIEAKISELAAWANGMAAVVLLNPDIGQGDFSAAADRLGADASGVRNISLTNDYIVRRVHPVESNSTLIGVDLRKLPNQIQGVEKALHSSRPVFLGPVDLVQGGQGFIMRLAVPVLSEKVDRSGSLSMISIVVDSDRFFQGIDLDVENSGTNILITDGSETIYGSSTVLEQDPVVTQLTTPTNSWQVALAPKAGWPLFSPNASTVAGIALMRTFLAIVVLHTIFSLLRRKQIAEDRLLAAIEAVDDGFAIFDPDGRLAVSNRRYHEIYKTSEGLLTPGATFEEIIRGGVARGQYPDAIGHEESWIRERLAAHYSGDQAIEQRLDSGKWLKIAERKTKDGSIVGFRVDITELKLATEAAMAADRAKSDFIGVLSHELRTPLTIVVGYSRLISATNMLPVAAELRRLVISEGSPDLVNRFELLVAATEEMSSRVHKSAQHLLTLIDHLLDFSKIEAGMMKIEITDINAAAVLADVAETFRGSIDTKGLVFEVKVSEGYVRADEIRLRQILTNFLSNAVKFTDSGRILADAKVEEGKVLFRVEDTGCGIPEEMMSKIFGKFVQVDSSGSRRSGGTGLGLAICKSLVEQMDGKIGVERSPGGGSVFWFSLPLGSKGNEAGN